MRTAGIIGGIGPESTIEYYRLTIALYRERVRDGSYPPVVIDSIDLKRVVDLIGSNRLPEVTEYLLGELHKLARAGADFGVLAANTPHIVFEPLGRRSPIPLISIVTTTCEAAKARGLNRVGLLGTRFTMQARFYLDEFAQAGITVTVPSAEDQDYIHDKYMNELLYGLIRPETRDGLLAIIQRLKGRERIDGLILGGTELPLILRDAEHVGIPFLDTTKLHVEQLVAHMLA